jgi:flagellin
MVVNHNISALIANANLNRTNDAAEASMEKLSSGYRINKAADDAAGMAISQRMKAQIRGLEQASRNASDGISAIQTAEGALNETEAILQRARELAVQAANDTNTAEDREQIQAEIDQLLEEINRISTDTEFNKKTLLNGDLDRATHSDNIKVKVLSISDEVASQKYQIQVTKDGTSATITGTAPTIAGTTYANAGKLYINGEEVEITKGESQADAIADIINVCERVGVELTRDATTNVLTFTAKESGSHRTVDIKCTDTNLASELGLTVDQSATGTDAEVSVTTTDVATGKVTANAGFTSTTTVLAKGNSITIRDRDGFEMKLELSEGASQAGNPAGTANISILDAGPMTLQIGANEGQTIDVSIPRVDTETLGIENLNVLTHDSASEGITLVDDAIAIVSSVRSKLGAYQNRLDHAIANLDTAAENMTEALSRIEDTDMAEEMATYTLENVLSQAGISMLAQANQRPQQVLSLLQ